MEESDSFEVLDRITEPEGEEHSAGIDVSPVSESYDWSIPESEVNSNDLKFVLTLMEKERMTLKGMKQINRHLKNGLRRLESLGKVNQSLRNRLAELENLEEKCQETTAILSREMEEARNQLEGMNQVNQGLRNELARLQILERERQERSVCKIMWDCFCSLPATKRYIIIVVFIGFILAFFGLSNDAKVCMDELNRYKNSAFTIGKVSFF